jgi:23S rRNA pseudouridine1911/1915/1917 synthase
VVKNKPPHESGTLINYLIKDEKNNRSKAVSAENKSGLKAELSYKILAHTNSFFLLEVDPITGRHHQIRVQLSTMGSPIKGDMKYGFQRGNEDGSIHLHARKINFEHPVTKEKMEIFAPPPNEVVWNACMQALS